MGRIRRAFWLLTAWLALAPWFDALPRAAGQALYPPTHFKLSDDVDLDQADLATKAHLELVKEAVAGQQWEEAVESLRKLTEDHGGNVVFHTPRRYVSVRDFCHLQIAALPPDALALYRGRVDPQARRWYETGVAERDPRLLLNVVEQLFCSSWGDDALLALGEIALEQGDYGNARGYWEKILPPWYWARQAPATAEGTATWLVYPDTDIELSGVKARLAWVVILAGDQERARAGLDAFAREFGEAEGRFAGREAPYIETLGKLLDESAAWPKSPLDGDWPTFAGSPTRNKVLPAAIEIGAQAWRGELKETPGDIAMTPKRVAEKRGEPLSYFPLVVGDWVLVNDRDTISAFDFRTGAAAVGNAPMIYPSPDGGGPAAAEEIHRGQANCLGVARFTMTAFGNRLYARLGDPVTSRAGDNPGHPPVGGGSKLVAIDLARQGYKIGETQPPGDSWAFEGSPVTDGENVYVGLRQSGARPQAHVACYDADLKRLRWQRMVAGAGTLAQGAYPEITHNLLTFERGMLYYNTNLGAVAAIEARDGQTRWVFRYPRSCKVDLGDQAKHFYRDLTPCLYDGGVLYCAPSDSLFIFALDAPTGMFLWQTDLPGDAIHLLGVGGGNLLASGDKLWWINTRTGKLSGPPNGQWPDGPTPKGFGRGVLAGDKVYWPTAAKIYVFDQRTGAKAQEIELTTRDVGGGNLLFAGDTLLIATHKELFALRPHVGTGNRRREGNRGQVTGDRHASRR
ncbi:MAG TPA: PQQ-binding-like beta-propeller repeat protein [Pirellulales bacterium]|nr:PQQ-binding-like beta-propeller repeat protein [Pirellulales bacterium]